MNTPALKESVHDALLGGVINMPLNWALIQIALWLKLGPTTMAVFFTAVFFVVAVVRKYRLRIWYEQRDMG